MLGAIAGDMIGSPYESCPIKTISFPMTVDAFTDDTVLTVAVANAILTGLDYRSSIKSYAQQYPNLPYGGSFWHWIWDPQSIPYRSYGNGSRGVCFRIHRRSDGSGPSVGRAEPQSS